MIWMLHAFANLGELGIFRKLRWLSVIYYIQISVCNCGSNVFDMFLLSRTQKTLRAMARHPEHEPTGPNTTGFTQTPPTWNPVWDHSSSAHLAGHKKHIRGWRGLGSTCWKRRENTVVVHSRSIKLMVSLCVHHLSQGFHLALLNCYLYYVVFSKWWMFHDSKRLGMTERSHNLIHPVSSFCTSRLLWFWTRMKGEWLIGSVTRTTNRFTAINIYIYIFTMYIGSSSPVHIAENQKQGLRRESKWASHVCRRKHLVGYPLPWSLEWSWLVGINILLFFLTTIYPKLMDEHEIIPPFLDLKLVNISN